MLKTSVFASGSSIKAVSSQVTSSGSTQPGLCVGSSHSHGAATVSVNGASLEATYRLIPAGLSVLVQGFDSADPDGTWLHEALLLKPGEHRVVTVRRAHGQAVHFMITRIGDWVQISADDT